MPWMIFGVVISLMTLWIISGQNCNNIFNYFINSIDLVSGFKDCAAREEYLGKFIIPIAYVIIGVSFVVTYLLTMHKRFGWRSLWPTTVFAATLFILFQYSFVRQDASHTVHGWLASISLYVLVYPSLWNFTQGERNLRIALLACGISVVFILTNLWLNNYLPVSNILSQRVNGLHELITQGISQLETDRKKHLGLLKQKYPLPELNGSLDTSTFDVGLSEAYGQQPMIRPTVTIFNANTPKMTQCNKSYLEAPSGPTTIVFPTKSSIDARYPMATDSMGLVSQKTHYWCSGNIGNLLILTRRASNSKMGFELLGDISVSFNECIPVPDVGNSMIFLQFEIEQTYVGKSFSALYKPAIVFFNITANNKAYAYRLTRSLSQEGMILSPLVWDPVTFRTFYRDIPLVIRPSSISFACENNQEWQYRDKIKVKLYKLDIS